MDKCTRGVRNSIMIRALGINLLAYIKDDEGAEVVTGFMYITFEPNLKLGGNILWINSTYVPEDWRGKGVFNALYSHVLEKAKTDPWIKAIRLYVETTNVGAQHVYRKIGMTNLEDEYDFYEIDLQAPPKQAND